MDNDRYSNEYYKFEDQNVEEVEDSSIDTGANNVSHPTFGFRCLKIRGGTPKQNRLAHLAFYGNVAESEIPQVIRYMLVPEPLWKQLLVTCSVAVRGDTLSCGPWFNRKAPC
ncbi:hypothetical protein KIN20_026418 [Parelaphostrongylus tenuis]|uniref:Uncharacterized protein n=1 Tax=Parelaphostrongylus tenuis TaxID=148309 RepID=A0AAD5QY18_PARTN|nr:hypothetical protein KIN20_026418 [Parelaphostrongylus tenuis]